MNRVVAYLPLLLLIALAVSLSHFISASRELQMDSDEASHAMRALAFYEPLRSGDLERATRELLLTDWYPPVYGVLLSTFFAVAGVSLTTARHFSLVCFVLLGFALWQAARRSSRGEPLHPLITAFPVFSLLLEPGFRQVAVLVMLETPVVLMAFLTLVVFARGWLRESVWTLVGASLLCALTLGLKYNYGVLALAGIGAGCLWGLIRAPIDQRMQRVRCCLAGLLPVVLIALFWFGALGQWEALVAYGKAQPSKSNIWTLAHLTYYARFLAYGNPLTAAAIGALIVSGCVGPRQPVSVREVACAAYLLVALVGLTLESQQSARFGLAMLPSLWLLAADRVGVSLSRVLDRVNGKHLMLGGTALTTVLLMSQPNTLVLHGIYENLDSTVHEAYRFVNDELKQDGAFPAIRFIERGATESATWNGPALDFALTKRCLRAHANMPCDIVVNEVTRNRPERRAIGPNGRIVVFEVVTPGAEPRTRKELRRAKLLAEKRFRLPEKKAAALRVAIYEQQRS
jgi:hypothetical protein